MKFLPLLFGSALLNLTFSSGALAQLEDPYFGGEFNAERVFWETVWGMSRAGSATNEYASEVMDSALAGTRLRFGPVSIEPGNSPHGILNVAARLREELLRRLEELSEERIASTYNSSESSEQNDQGPDRWGTTRTRIDIGPITVHDGGPRCVASHNLRTVARNNISDKLALDDCYTAIGLYESSLDLLRMAQNAGADVPFARRSLEDSHRYMRRVCSMRACE